MGILDKVRGSLFEDDQPEQRPVAPTPAASIVADVASKPVRVDAGDLASLRNKIKPDSGPLVRNRTKIEFPNKIATRETQRLRGITKVAELDITHQTPVRIGPGPPKTHGPSQKEEIRQEIRQKLKGRAACLPPAPFDV